MAGVKGRSGRKRDVSVLSIREVIDQAVTAADWRKMWQKVAAAAMKGDLPSMRFLTEYRHGGPLKEAPSAGPTASATYFLPYRKGDVVPPGAVLEQEGPPAPESGAREGGGG